MGTLTGLGHFGIFVRELRPQQRFYGEALGLTVTDGGGEFDRGVFLSAQPNTEHHELALIQVPEQPTDASVVAFRVTSLATLKEVFQELKEYGATIDSTTSRGNALSILFRDSEGNQLEAYWATGADPADATEVDLDTSEEQLRAQLGLPATSDAPIEAPGTGSKLSELGYVGIYVQDLEKTQDFYTRILGMKLTDGGGAGATEAYLSSEPEREHHELVLTVDPERHTNAQQISWTTGSLTDLRELYHAVRDYGVKFDQIVNHGIAFGCYFRDPEDNRVEVYWSTGIDYPQPLAMPIDLDKTDEELLALLDELKPLESNTPGYYGRDLGLRLPASR